MFTTSKGLRCLTERHELVALARELKMRPDWHEPDEQDVTTEVFGTSFDNAGTWPTSEEAGRASVEQHVILYRTTEYGPNGEPTRREPVAAVNLATLFGWASEPTLPEKWTAPAGSVPERKWDI